MEGKSNPGLIDRLKQSRVIVWWALFASVLAGIVSVSQNIGAVSHWLSSFVGELPSQTETANREILTRLKRSSIKLVPAERVRAADELGYKGDKPNCSPSGDVTYIPVTGGAIFYDSGCMFDLRDRVVDYWTNYDGGEGRYIPVGKGDLVGVFEATEQGIGGGTGMATDLVTIVPVTSNGVAPVLSLSGDDSNTGWQLADKVIEVELEMKNSYRNSSDGVTLTRSGVLSSYSGDCPSDDRDKCKLIDVVRLAPEVYEWRDARDGFIQTSGRVEGNRRGIDVYSDKLVKPHFKSGAVDIRSAN